MYVKGSNYVMFFTNENKENTEKVLYGRVSESIKVGDGESDYEYESWDVRFVGKAREKANELNDKQTIILTEWACRNPYSKEKKRTYPYLMVFDFDVK